jgi:glucokinase
VKRSVFVGIDIGGTNIKVAIVDPSGSVLVRGMIPTMPADGPQAAFKRIGRMAAFLAGEKHTIAGAGVGCAGMVEASSGMLLSSPNMPTWQQVKLRAVARRTLRVPAIVDNDATAAAYGEFVAGAGRGCSSFICLTLGTGVGGGVILDGAVLRGAHNFAGEIGHMTIEQNGPRCSCGNRGCLEAFLGTKGLLRLARRRLRTRKGKILGRSVTGTALTPRAITEAALAGDRVALAILDEAATYLGVGIASVVNIFDPEVVAIGGGVSGAFQCMEKRLNEVVSRRAYIAAANTVHITRAHLGNDATAVGAAMIAKESVA